MKQQLVLAGYQIPVIQTFGKKGYEKPPFWRKQLYDLNTKILKKLDITLYSPKAVGELIAVQKWKEKYVPGYFGENSVYVLQNKGYPLLDIIRKIGYAPYEIHISKGFPFISLNGLLDEGMDEMWDLCDGTAGTTLYNNANARVGVGNSAAAFNKTHTGLQGASTAFAAMDAGFPTSTTQKINAKGSFPSGQAEFAWEEYTIDNGSVRNKNLNRALSSKGTKPAGETWTLEVQITLS